MHCEDQSVTVRYTTDTWATFEDTSAICSGFQDNSEKKYTFEIDLEDQTSLEFAICFRAMQWRALLVHLSIHYFTKITCFNPFNI